MERDIQTVLLSEAQIQANIQFAGKNETQTGFVPIEDDE